MKTCSKGFSLVEAALALGLLGGIGLLVMTQTSHEMQSRVMTTLEAEASELTMVIRAQLEHPLACEHSLLGKNAASDTFTSIKDKNGNNRYEVGKEYSGLNLMSLTLRSGGNTGSFVVPSGPGFAQVELLFQKPKAQGTKETFLKRFPLWVRVDGSSRIERCNATNLSFSSLWIRSYTNPYDIFFQAGPVGINQGTPFPQLDVGGTIQARNVSGDVIAVGGEQNDRYRILLRRNLPFTVTHGGVPGDMVVRGLIPTQELRPNGSPNCSALSDVGGFRYNAGIGRLELCVANRFGTATEWIHFLE